MKNILSASLLLAVSNQFFETHRAINEVFITEDGQPFILENRADLHASQNGLTYKKFTRSFDQEKIIEGETKVPVENVEASKQPDALDLKNPELRGSDLKEAEKAQEQANQKAKNIENDESYESVAVIVAKIPSLNLEELKAYLEKENSSETPRVTLIKALTEAIEKLKPAEKSE